MASLATSGQLQNVIVYCSKVRKIGPVGSQIIRPPFDAKPQLMTHIMSVEIFKFCVVTFHMAQSIDGLLVQTTLPYISNYQSRQSELYEVCRHF